MDDDTTTAGPDEDEAATSVVRIGGPADILGVLPYRIGFHPSESLVVVCLEGPRRRDRLVMRVDLPSPAEQRGVVADIAERVAFVGASSSVVVVYTEDADAGRGRTRLARASLVQALRSALRHREVKLHEALLVRAGRWWSYLCHDPGCCPPEGTPLPEEPTAATLRYAAEAVGQGERVLADRDELRRSVEPSDHAVAAAVRRLAGKETGALVDDVLAEGGAASLRVLTLATMARLRSRWARGDRRLEPADAALVLLGLHDKRARDATMTGVLDDDADTLLDLLGALARQADDPDAAPVCTALGWVAYAHGHGALAAVAAERALRCAPDYSMARLLLDGLDRMLGPDHVRAVSEAVRAELDDLDVLDDLEDELDDWEDPMDELDGELGDAC
ncbi:MAG: hypothetical protein QOD68_1506 [Actinomycetota bacterium]|nr:hypothetical protein [Actinomycetota bacterium]